LPGKADACTIWVVNGGLKAKLPGTCLLLGNKGWISRKSYEFLQWRRWPVSPLPKAPACRGKPG